ncbi:MAG: metallopeptidase TldD-related protein [Acidobacteriaceae bacterium]
MRIFAAFLLLSVFLPAGSDRAQAQDDVVMKAMHDELARSINELHFQDLEKPYFISYRVVDSDNTSVSASFGALSASHQGRSRNLSVEVRVGSYKLDNTNFAAFGFDMSSVMQVFNGHSQLPLDDNYQELRRQIWLATDATYKKAVEDFSRKKAALQNKVDTDNTPDFTQETPVTIAMDAEPVHADRAQFETMARNLSGLFRQMPDVNTSTVSFFASNSYIRYLNSEGTSYTRREPRVTFTARASTQAADGTPLEDLVWVYARSISALPSADELGSRVRALGQELKDLRTASEIENYNGPVLAEGDAAAQLFAWAFVPNLLGARTPINDSQMSALMGREGPQENPFLDKVGAKVLPDFLSVTDNATLAEYKGVPLAGWCKVDEDGVPTREMKLVENGILKTLLTTRDPVRGFDHSSGSRHAGQTAPSNLFVVTDSGLSQADLRARFLAILKTRNKEYGIVVRRMRNARLPVLAWKVFPDGREELIRGTQFTGLNGAAFKEIVAASKEQNILTVSRRPSAANGLGAFMGGLALGGEDESTAPVTLAVPSLLFDDVTLHKVRGETPKPPVMPHPYFDKN